MEAFLKFLSDSKVIETLGPYGTGGLAVLSLLIGIYIQTRSKSPSKPTVQADGGIAGDNHGTFVSINSVPRGAWLAVAAGLILLVVAFFSAGDSTDINCGIQSGEINSSSVTIACD